MKLPYEKRKALYGYGFISIWAIGTIMFFIIPLVTSIFYSFSAGNPQSGMIGPFVGIANYKEAFTSDPLFRKYLVQVLKDTAIKTPIILIFSLFVAVILNQKFKGRAFSRAIFFLPVIIATGPVYEVITGDLAQSGNSSGEQFSTMFQTNFVEELLSFLGIYNINETLTEYIQNVADEIFSMVWNAGIQILIFLAALQNIPFSAKEAAQIEGATAWEYFWKITLPYVSPMILANLIFTIVDSFTDPKNVVMKRVIDIQKEWNFGLAASMAWSYFLIVFVAIGIIFLIVNKFIYYEVE